MLFAATRQFISCEKLLISSDLFVLIIKTIWVVKVT